LRARGERRRTIKSRRAQAATYLPTPETIAPHYDVPLIVKPDLDAITLREDLSTLQCRLKMESR
jgi:hypothetical protein